MVDAKGDSLDSECCASCPYTLLARQSPASLKEELLSLLVGCRIPFCRRRNTTSYLVRILIPFVNRPIYATGFALVESLPVLGRPLPEWLHESGSRAVEVEHFQETAADAFHDSA
jgi:hypothetical protein